MSTQTREFYQSDLTDQQWNFIECFLPKPAKTGRPRCNQREVINGILYVLKTGCKWKDMPHDIQSSPSTCHRTLLEYQKRRIWQKIFEHLTRRANRKGKINMNNSYHDASVIKSKKGIKKKQDIRANTW